MLVGSFLVCRLPVAGGGASETGKWEQNQASRLLKLDSWHTLRAVCDVVVRCFLALQYYQSIFFRGERGAGRGVAGVVWTGMPLPVC